MTVLIALEHPETGEKAIAADSRCSAGGRILSDSQRKIVPVGGVAWLGLSGHQLAAGILQPKLRDLTYHGAEDLALQIRAILRESGIWKWEEGDGSTSTIDINGVLSAPDGTWYIGPDFSAVWTEPGWPAVGGSGGSEAAGAALAIIRATGSGWRPEDVCREAVEVACTLDSGCGGAAYVVAVPRHRKAAAA